MGAIVWDLCESGSFNKNVRGSYAQGGAHTSSTSASDLTDGAAGAGSAIDASVGQVLTIRNDEDCRIRFGGATATATEGILVFAGVQEYIEVSHPGAVSVIDLA